MVFKGSVCGIRGIWSVSSVAAVLLLLMTSAGFARFGGFFAGTQLGLGFLKGVHRHIDTNNKPGSFGFNELGIVAGVHGGYLSYLESSKLIIGGELYGNFTTSKSKDVLKDANNSSIGEASFKQQYSVGAALIGGVALNPKVIIYGRLGFESNKFKINYTNLSEITPNSANYNISLRGLVPGIGFYTKITNSLLIGGEYSYVLMSKKDFSKDESAKKWSFSFKPVQHRLSLKLSYMF